MFGKYFETAQKQQQQKKKLEKRHHASSSSSFKDAPAAATTLKNKSAQSEAGHHHDRDATTPTTESRRSKQRKRKAKNDAAVSSSASHQQQHHRDKHKKQRRRHDSSDARHHRPNNKKPRKLLTQEALDLSKRLQELSRQKRLQDALDLYWSHSCIVDGFHACIVMDCCARCGAVDQAAQIMAHLRQQQQQQQSHSETTTTTINVEIQTAFLKALVHAGRMHAAVDLFRSMMMIVPARQGQNDNNNMPNIRTLNTLLRGCLWTAATTRDNKNGGGTTIAGGVETSEEAWKLYCDQVVGNNDDASALDASAFEYSIALLCQALRVKEAHERIQQYQTLAGIRVKGKASFVVSADQQQQQQDSLILETLAVAYIGLARAHALRGEMEEMWQACQRVLNAVKTCRAQITLSAQQEAATHSNEQQPTNKANSSRQKKNQKAAGGKRAFKKAEDSSSTAIETKRAASNQAYRIHRLKEVESEALALLKLRKNTKSATTAPLMIRKTVARRLLCQLFYFSGGGTTELSPSANTSTGQEELLSRSNDNKMLIPTWLSFGLSQLVDEDVRDTPIEKLNSKHLFRSLGIPMAKPLGSSDGRLNLKDIFADAQLPVDIEIGAGFGDWVSRQSRANTNTRNYIAVELRADRVAQIFARGVLFDSTTIPRNTNAAVLGSLGNLCVVGSECGSFLRDRIQRSTVSNIFANHPEPPTQTYGDNRADLYNIMQGKGDEPAHMLNSMTIIAMANCLKPNGRIVIVTDNRWFARLLCATVVRAMTARVDLGLRSANASQLQGFRHIESFGGTTAGANNNKVELLEGQPNEAIGHVVHDPKSGGASYFDRLWRTGAGSHADSKSRFVVVLHKDP